MWRKSTYSAYNGSCVEIAQDGRRVLVRDSKDPRGPVLSFAPAQWRVFLRDLGHQPSGRSSG